MDRILLNDLFDIYQQFLTLKEQEIFKLYYQEDYSLTEIKDILHISRSAIHNTLKIVENKLLTYEDKIHQNDIKKELIDILKEEDINKIKERITKIVENE